MTKDTMLSKVLDKLKSEKGKWNTIAKESGIPYETVKKIADGRTKNPGFNHVQTLHDYFSENSYLKDED